MKHCQYCNRDLPEDRFYKGRARCKDCQAAYKRDLRKGVRHPIERPKVRICKCGNRSDEVEFKSTNKCMPCHKEYMKSYRKDNRSKISGQVQSWKDGNRDHYKAKNRERYAMEDGKQKHIDRVEKTFRSWLSQKLSALKSHAEKPGPHDPKSGPQRDFDIDLDYVISVLKEQGERCAITNIPLTHRYNDLYAASTDRIDSSKGHVKGNIQVICQCVNKMKGTHTNKETKDFLDACYHQRCKDAELNRDPAWESMMYHEDT